MRSHREQQQRARLRQPRLRLQTGHFFPEEEKLGLRKPAQTPQLQLPEVSQDLCESSVLLEPVSLLHLSPRQCLHPSFGILTDPVQLSVCLLCLSTMDAAAVLRYVGVQTGPPESGLTMGEDLGSSWSDCVPSALCCPLQHRSNALGPVYELLWNTHSQSHLSAYVCGETCTPLQR